MGDIIKSDILKERESANSVKPVGVKTYVKDKSMKRRVAEAFIASDRGSIKDHVIFDVIIPSMKNAITDVITDAVNILLFGDKSSRARRKDSSHTAYGSFWASSYNEERRRDTLTTNMVRSSMGRYLEAKWHSKEDAMVVLNALLDIKDCYPAVTVANFYELIDDQENFPIEAVHSKWGWKSLVDVKVVPIGGGDWGITLPRPVHLD